jgi:hypothetical protein
MASLFYGAGLVVVLLIKVVVEPSSALKMHRFEMSLFYLMGMKIPKLAKSDWNGTKIGII